MKFFQKRWVAWTITVCMILVALGIGAKKTEALHQSEVINPTGFVLQSSQYGKYTVDQADLLSNSTKKKIAQMNASFDGTYGSVLALVTLKDASDSDIVDLAYDWADELELGGYDLILIIDEATDEWHSVYGRELSLYADNDLEKVFSEAFAQSGSYTVRILRAYENLGSWYRQTSLSSVHKQNSSSDKSVLMGLLIVIIVFLILRKIFRRARTAARSAFGTTFAGSGSGSRNHYHSVPYNHFGSTFNAANQTHSATHFRTSSSRAGIGKKIKRGNSRGNFGRDRR